MRLAALIPVGGLAATLVACGGADRQADRPVPSAPSPTPPMHPATSHQIERQDDAPEGQHRYEQQAMADRPLLDHLPLTVGPVRISIAGLARDGRVRVAIDPAGRNPRDARDVYRDALQAYGDDGHAYLLEVRP